MLIIALSVNLLLFISLEKVLLLFSLEKVLLLIPLDKMVIIDLPRTLFIVILSRKKALLLLISIEKRLIIDISKKMLLIISPARSLIHRLLKSRTDHPEVYKLPLGGVASAGGRAAVGGVSRGPVTVNLSLSLLNIMNIRKKTGEVEMSVWISQIVSRNYDKI